MFTSSLNAVATASRLNKKSETHEVITKRDYSKHDKHYKTVEIFFFFYPYNQEKNSLEIKRLAGITTQLLILEFRKITSHEAA